MKNDRLEVMYLQGDSVEVVRTMNQDELAVLLLDDDIFLLGVNQDKTHRARKKHHSSISARDK